MELAPCWAPRSPTTMLLFRSTTHRRLPPPKPPQTPHLGVGASIGPPLASNMKPKLGPSACHRHPGNGPCGTIHRTELCPGAVRVSNLLQGALRDAAAQLGGSSVRARRLAAGHCPPSQVRLSSRCRLIEPSDWRVMGGRMKELRIGSSLLNNALQDCY